MITGVQVTAMAVGERAVLQTFRELGQAIGLYGVRCLVTALEGTCKHGLGLPRKYRRLVGKLHYRYRSSLASKCPRRQVPPC